MRLFKNKWVLAGLAFIGGVVMADKVRPMLENVPVLGGLMDKMDNA